MDNVIHVYIEAYRKILVICAGSIFNFAPKRAFFVEFIVMGRGLVLFAFRNFALLKYVGLHL